MVTLSSLRQSKQDQQGTAGLDSSEVSVLAGSGTSVFDTLDSLPNTGLTAGSKALVEDVNRLYVSDGSGWYNIDLATGFTPRWDSGGEPNAAYTIADSQTPLIVTARAVDSDSGNLINQSFVSDSAQYMATISNDSSVWTFTPKTKVQIGTAVAAGNLTDSNGDFIYTFKWSDGINFITKAVTIAYNPAGNPNVHGDRVVTSSGYADATSTYNDIMNYFSISTQGNAQQFGTTTRARMYTTGGGNGTIGTCQGGYQGSQATTYDDIDYWVYGTVANAQDFGDLAEPNTIGASVWNSNRVLIAGGKDATASPNYSHGRMQEINIATTATATRTGTLSYGYQWHASTADATRAIFGTGHYDGGNQNGAYDSRYDGLEYVSIDTAANAAVYGVISLSPRGKVHIGVGVVSDGTKGYFTGGVNQGNPQEVPGTDYTNRIETVTIQTLGNGTDFADLVAHIGYHMQACDGTSYGVSIGGTVGGQGDHNRIDRFALVTAGTATDHGDLTLYKSRGSASSGI